MIALFSVLSFIVFTKTISYSIFEIKKQNNTFGGIVLFIISFITFIGSNIIIRIR